MRCVPVVCLLFVMLFHAVLMTPEVQGDLRVKRSYDVSTAPPQLLSDLETCQASLMLMMQTELTSLRTKMECLENNVTSLRTKMESLENNVTSLKNTVSTLENTTSRAAAFTARISLDRDSQGVSLGHQQTVIFNEAITNVGDAFNTHTGIFTAPVAGTFAFFLTQMGISSSGDIYLDIVKNGVGLDTVFAHGRFNRNGRNDQGSTHVTTHLRLGDQVWVRQNSGDAVRGYTWTVFTGYLLHAD